MFIEIQGHLKEEYLRIPQLETQIQELQQENNALRELLRDWQAGLPEHQQALLGGSHE